MNTCLTCGGLIMELGKAYGYAGPTCQCIVPPKIQQPMINYGRRVEIKEYEEIPLFDQYMRLRKDYNELQEKLASAEAAIGHLRDALKRLSFAVERQRYDWAEKAEGTYVIGEVLDAKEKADHALSATSGYERSGE